MLALGALLPNKEINETRVATIQHGSYHSLKEGQYTFRELFCEELDCDCRRVMIKVFDQNGNALATLSYGWESYQFYLDWNYGEEFIAQNMVGINLYELQPQSTYCDSILDLFRSMMKDQSYADRIKSQLFTTRHKDGQRKRSDGMILVSAVLERSINSVASPSTDDN